MKDAIKDSLSFKTTLPYILHQSELETWIRTVDRLNQTRSQSLRLIGRNGFWEISTN